MRRDKVEARGKEKTVDLIKGLLLRVFSVLLLERLPVLRSRPLCDTPQPVTVPVQSITKKEPERKKVTRVQKMIEDELKLRDNATDDEPELAFTVRLPMTDMAHLEQMAAYLGEKKTRFAAGLLLSALEDAFETLIELEEENGNGDRLREHFDGRWEMEDGNGSVTSSGRVTGAQYLKRLRQARNGKGE